MTTTIKLHASLPSGAIPDTLATRMWDGLGSHHVAIAELRVAERTEPDHHDDTDPSAKLRIVSIEFAADDEDAHLLRDAARARYASRTAAGTLEFAGDSAAAGTSGVSPNVPFHQLLADKINDLGSIGKYVATAEYDDQAGTTTIVVTSQVAEPDTGDDTADDDADLDELSKAARLVVEVGYASGQMLCRKLRIGMPRAVQLLDALADQYVVDHGAPGTPSETHREVLATPEQLDDVLERIRTGEEQPTLVDA